MSEHLHFDDQTLIRYLDKEMDDEERSSFEQQLQRDPALRQRLDGLKIAILGIRHYGTSEKVRAIHKEMMDEMQPSGKGKVVSMKNVLKFGFGIAASVLVIFLVVELYSTGPN